MKYIVKIIPLIFYALLIGFLVVYISSIDFKQLTAVEPVWHFVFIGSILALASRYWQIYIWFVILKSLGAKDAAKHKLELVNVYSKAWLGRYIPGKAVWILGKIYFASKFGLSKNKLAVSSLLEGALQVTVILAVALALLLLDNRLSSFDGVLKLSILLVLAISIIAILPPVFNRILALAYRIFRKKSLPLEHRAGNRTVVVGALLYVVGALLYGISLFFITKAVYPALEYSDMLLVVGAGSLAGALGILAFFAPSGIGVRDGVLLVLFSLIMPKEAALTAVIASRLWDVFMDLLFFSLSRAALFIGNKR